MEKVTKVTRKSLQEIIRTKEPIGEFYTENKDGTYTAVDNTDGRAFAEDFNSLRKVKKYFESPNIDAFLEEINHEEDNLIEVFDDSIYIKDKHGEITSWVEDEWIEDPSIIPSIANAIHIYHNEGPQSLRERINNKVFDSHYANELLKHYSHDIEISIARHNGATYELSLDCNDCNETILDYKTLLELEEG